MKAADVLEALTGVRPDIDLTISEAVIDSRTVRDKGMFIAIPGEHVDGHDFVSQAFDNGAALVLVEKQVNTEIPSIDTTQTISLKSLRELKLPALVRVENTVAALQKIASWWRDKHQVRVVGITGSVGKSTTKELVAAVLSERYSVLKNKGNLNNEIGLPLSLLQLNADHEVAVLEMGFYVPGEIKLLCDIAKPEIGVITNIGTVHAERAGSKEVIAQGKAELVEALPANGTAILNFDDPYVRPMEAKANCSVLWYGLDPEADWWADEIVSDGLKGIQFKLHFHRDELKLKVPMIGRHSVHTILRAVAVAQSLGMDIPEIIHALTQNRSQLRLVVTKTKSGATVIDDSYNASPESTLAALNLLDEIPGRKIAILGDMLELGQYERQGHELVGRRASEVVDLLITVGKLGKTLGESAVCYNFPAEKVVHFDEVPDVSGYLKTILQENDIVLIKGSNGLRMDRIVSALEVNSG